MYRLLGLLLLTVMPLGLKAQEIKTLDMDIIYTRGPNGTKVSAKKWRKACIMMGKTATPGGGLWGYGMIDRYRCLMGKKVIKGSKKLFAPLELRIKSTGDKLDIAFYFKYKRKNKPRRKKFTGFSIAESEKIWDGLASQKIAIYLMTRLLDASPFATVANLDGSTYRLKRGLKNFPPPKSLVAYTLTLEPKTGYLLPKQIATLSVTDQGGSGTSFEVTYNNRFYDRSAKVFLHNSEGMGLLASGLERRMNRGLKAYDSKTVKESLLQTLAGGYAGFRYGLPLSTDDTIVAKSSIVSIFTEVRAGPLEGLRWFWDFAPQVEETNEAGNEVSFTWSRPTLGWAITFKLIEGILGTFSMDVTPKLGAMDLDAKLAIDQESSTSEVSEFRVKNSLSVGVDGGITWETPIFLIRAWGTYDFSGLASISKDKVNITSIRGGVDTYWSLFEVWDKYDFGLLAFASAEKISIEQVPDDDELVEGETELTAVGYVTTFAGLGATLQW